MLGAIGVFVIERDFVKASAFALAGAVLTYFGFMHGEAVGIGGGLGVTPGVALAYALVAAVFFALAKSESVSYSAPVPAARDLRRGPMRPRPQARRGARADRRGDEPATTPRLACGRLSVTRSDQS